MSAIAKKVETMGRRVMPKARKPVASARTLTVGDLVAAAFDAAEGDVEQVKKLLRSNELRRALGRRIELI